MISGYTINKTRELHNIDQYQCFLIGAIKHWQNDADITISALIDIGKFSKVGSLATIHRAIMRNIEAGFFTIKQHERDKRIKYVALTKKAEKYLTDLNKGA